jgi:hypothetical protein
VAFRLKATFYFLVVVYLSIKYDPKGPLTISHRLMPGWRKINDGEAYMR